MFTSDVCTRLKLGLGPCGGVKCIIDVNNYCSNLKKWSIEEQIFQQNNAFNKINNYKKNTFLEANLAASNACCVPCVFPSEIKITFFVPGWFFKISTALSKPL